MKCSKCQGEMEAGIMYSHGGPYTGVAIWGKSRAFWGKVEGKKDVITYHCNNCGYLESYAK